MFALIQIIGKNVALTVEGMSIWALQPFLTESINCVMSIKQSMKIKKYAYDISIVMGRTHRCRDADDKNHSISEPNGCTMYSSFSTYDFLSCQMLLSFSALLSLLVGKVLHATGWEYPVDTKNRLVFFTVIKAVIKHMFYFRVVRNSFPLE